ncbi:hypothetical protein ACOME3_001264 [Neoechinorhynchus agilis]
MNRFLCRIKAFKTQTATITVLRPTSNFLFRARSTKSNDFESLADFTLDSISDQLSNVTDSEDKIHERNAINQKLDHFFSNGVLEITVKNEGEHENVFILNKQSTNQEIWYSSPISGPKRYRLSCGGNRNRWLCTRDENDDLVSRLSNELGSILSIDLRLKEE